MNQFVFQQSAGPAAGAPPSHDQSCELMWELFSTFLCEKIYYNGYDAATGAHVQNRDTSVADHYLALLAATCQRLARDAGLVHSSWRAFYEYAIGCEPGLAHDSEPVFLSRVAQAYAPLDYVRQMNADQLRDYTHRAFVTVNIRAYEIARGAKYSQRILARDSGVIDELRSVFNQLSRAHRLELGAELSRRGRVTTKTAYDDAGEHIRLLTEQMKNMQQQVEALAAENRRLRAVTRAASVAASENRQLRDKLVKQQRASSKLLSYAKSQVAARTVAEEKVSQLRDDARTLLSIQRMRDNLARPEEMYPPSAVGAFREPAPEDSVSVRGDRPIGWSRRTPERSSTLPEPRSAPAAPQKMSSVEESDTEESEEESDGEVTAASIMESFAKDME